MTALSEQKVARFGCLHESLQIWNRAGQKVDLLSSGPTLSRSKIRPVPPVPCTQGGTVQVFVRAKICPDSCKRGLSLAVSDLRVGLLAQPCQRDPYKKRSMTD